MVGGSAPAPLVPFFARVQRKEPKKTRPPNGALILTSAALGSQRWPNASSLPRGSVTHLLRATSAGPAPKALRCSGAPYGGSRESCNLILRYSNMIFEQSLQILGGHMRGQWIGKISGTNEGRIILNIDRDRPYQGILSISDDSSDRVPAHANVRLNTTGTELSGVLSQFVPAIYGASSELYVAAQGALPKSGILSGRINDNKIDGTWETNIQTKGKFNLIKYEKDFFVKSDKILSWHDYYAWALEKKRKTTWINFSWP